MLAHIAVVPSAPLLVPELAGPQAFDTAPVRAAATAAVRRLATHAGRWVAVGVADRPLGGPARVTCTDHGDFGAYGVPIRVQIPRAAGAEPPPLAMLLAGWLGAQAAQAPSSITPCIVDPDLAPDVARQVGRDLGFGDTDPVNLLVVADGATALSPGAPGGGERESAWALQRRIDAALAAADPAGLAGLTVAECVAEGVGTRVAWQVLAGVLESLAACGIPVTSEISYAAAPFGVGYTVGNLTPQGAR
ncbi:MAG: hypothetical protein WAW85_03380 [Gordonia sp. (in: high G+C Gram-positive bacteria)]|uniref:hypothetical protein n=1 Tax=Gordonia sp. (in: high G+C Gram-positive bacteria) TaxID=84139 RepID=UPI003BB5A667